MFSKGFLSSIIPAGMTFTLKKMRTDQTTPGECNAPVKLGGADVLLVGRGKLKRCMFVTRRDRVRQGRQS